MKKTISILLTFVFLIGNLQLTLSTHHCGGLEVKSGFALGHKDLNCGMEELISQCESIIDHTTSFSNKDCCKNSFNTYQITSEFHSIYKTEFHFHLIQIVKISLSNQLISKTNTTDLSKHIIPPLPEKDKQILFQTFLI